MRRHLRIFVNQGRRERDLKDRLSGGYESPHKGDFVLTRVLEADERFRRSYARRWEREVDITAGETPDLIAAIQEGRVIAWNGMRWKVDRYPRAIQDRGLVLLEFSMQAFGGREVAMDAVGIR